MYLDSTKKTEIFTEFGGGAANTGSAESQIALFTYRIKHLTEHMKQALFPKALIDILDQQVQLEQKKARRYEHGVAGIRRIFNCSYPTAHKLMETIIKPAVHRQGRVILTDVDLALKLFQESKSVHSIQDL